jgi:hypothetical protein
LKRLARAVVPEPPGDLDLRPRPTATPSARASGGSAGRCLLWRIRAHPGVVGAHPSLRPAAASLLRSARRRSHGRPARPMHLAMLLELDRHRLGGGLWLAPVSTSCAYRCPVSMAAATPASSSWTRRSLHPRLGFLTARRRCTLHVDGCRPASSLARRIAAAQSFTIAATGPPV